MPFTYRAITANCGNDSIGQDASKRMVGLLVEDKADFFVINCQEVDFVKTPELLERLAQQHGYKVACLGQMVTHTKPSTQLHSRTGIANYVLYKNDLTVNVIMAKETRRNPSRYSGSGYNKGGLITDLVITRDANGLSEERIKIQAISGHLDSNNAKKRSQDWHNLHRASSAHVTSWQELVAISPHLRLSGYDANTRNKLQDGNEFNLLKENPDSPEVQGLYRAPFADRHFSTAITYSKSDGDQIEDHKRPGYAARGMLDYVGISDGSIGKDQSISEEDVISVGLEASTGRDHHVVMSPLQDYHAPVSDFELVKGQMASRLHYAAPLLAQKIRHLEESEDAKLYLTGIYQQFLSPNGLLHKEIALHTQKLASFDRLMQASLLQDPQLRQAFSDTFFSKTNWCDDTEERLMKKAKLMDAFLTSLDQCNDVSEIRIRLDWLHELEKKLDDDIDPVAEFNIRAIDEYLRIRSELASAVQEKTHPELKAAGERVLRQLDEIAPPYPEGLKHQFLDSRSLDKLVRVAKYCNNALAVIDTRDDAQARHVIAELKKVSEEVSTKSSLLWKKLSEVLSLFAQVVSVIVGLLPQAFIPESKASQNPVSTYKDSLRDRAIVNAERQGDIIDPDTTDNGGISPP